MYTCQKQGSLVWMTQNLDLNVSRGDYCLEGKVINPVGDCSQYGRLYDWAAAMKVSEDYNTSQYTNFSAKQGICPEGWRLPTQSELEGTAILNAQKAGVWNATSLLNDKFDHNGLRDYFWAIDQDYFHVNYKYHKAWAGVLLETATTLTKEVHIKTIGMSVRCVRDP